MSGKRERRIGAAFADRALAPHRWVKQLEGAAPGRGQSRIVSVEMGAGPRLCAPRHRRRVRHDSGAAERAAEALLPSVLDRLSV